MLAAALFLGGAIGVGLLGGRHAEQHGMQSLTFSMIATVEESLEMAGIIVYIWALLTYLAEHYGQVRLEFEGARSSAAVAATGQAKDVTHVAAREHHARP